MDLLIFLFFYFILGIAGVCIFLFTALVSLFTILRIMGYRDNNLIRDFIKGDI